LTDETKRARDGIRDFLAMIESTARRFEEKRAARAEVASVVGL